MEVKFMRPVVHRTGAAKRSQTPQRQSPQDLARELSIRFKRGRFDRRLFELTKSLADVTTSVAFDDPFCLKCRALVCEVRAWFGRTRAAQDAVRQGGELWNR